MKQILILGAGRSGIFLIRYLSAWCADNGRHLLVCDKDTAFMQDKLPPGEPLQYLNLDMTETEKVSGLVEDAELVVSMLPAFMHMPIALLCLKHGRHLATASYISEDMKALHEQVRLKNLVFLNEMGLDPGIDHMSAMQMMDKIRQQGGVITGFKSYCGGLVADEDDGDNPWKYKFSWNPRNVVLAAQGAPATYLEGGAVKLLPYQRVFDRPVSYNIPGYGSLEAYPNRDSLKYQEIYGLAGLQNMVRGTFRKPGYCKAWQIFVLLGLTDNIQVLQLPENCSMRQWLEMYLPASGADIRSRLQDICHCSPEDIDRLEWLGFFTEQPVPRMEGTSAEILEALLISKWKLRPDDKDLVVMLHHIEYTLNGNLHTHTASLVLQGEDATYTAMARTVGLPLAIGVKLLLENRISGRGVLAPVSEEFYRPVLEELAQLGIRFDEMDM